MESEKELLLYNICGKFLKNFDTFSDMDPFVKVSIGKSSNRTQTLKKSGKEPNWQNAITLNYYGENELKFESFDQDLTQNEQIGSATMKVSELKMGSGKADITVILKGEETGTISFEYNLKDLKANKHITLSNIKCSLVKKTELFLKCSPYLAVTAGAKRDQTSAIKGSNKQMAWLDTVRLSFENERQILFQLLDSNDKDNVIFSSKHLVEEFDQLKGFKEIAVTGRMFEFLGILSFDYQTANVVTEKQAADNAKNDATNLLTLSVVTLSSIKGQFLKDGFDPYVKVIAGSNTVLTDVVKKAKKDVEWNDSVMIYVEPKQTKITFVAFDKKAIKDEIIGVGEIFINDLKPISTVQLQNRNGENKGTLTFVPNSKKTNARALKITQIKAEFVKDHDNLSKMNPFVEVVIGGCVERTQTADSAQKNPTFTRSIQLKFADEDTIKFNCYDEDTTNNEAFGTGQLKISDITQQNGTKIVEIINDKKENAGNIRVSYQSNNILKKEIPAQPAQPVQSTKSIQSPEPIQQKSQNTIKLSSERQKDANKKSQKIIKQPESFKKGESPSKQSLIKQERKQLTQQSQLQHQNNQPFPKRDSPVKDDANVKKTSPPKKTTQQPIIQAERSNRFQEHQSLKDINRQASLQNVSKQLPPLIEKKNFGDKIYDKQSAMTLQKSILSYSMPKAMRFADQAKPNGSEPSYYVESCFRTDKSRGAGFGYGNRRPYPDWMQRNMKQNPAPGTYQSVAQHDQKKGRTFGISYKYYEKVMIPKEQKRGRPKLSPLKNKVPQH